RTASRLRSSVREDQIRAQHAQANSRNLRSLAERPRCFSIHGEYPHASHSASVTSPPSAEHQAHPRPPRLRQNVTRNSNAAAVGRSDLLGPALALLHEPVLGIRLGAPRLVGLILLPSPIRFSRCSPVKGVFLFPALFPRPDRRPTRSPEGAGTPAVGRR